MGLWNTLFGKKEVKPYKPEKFFLNNRILKITAKHDTMISIYDNALSSIEGTVTELKQNKNEVIIKNLEGLLFLSKNDDGFIEINCEGTLQGDWHYSGSIEAKTLHLTIRKPMKLNIYAQNVSAEGFTNVQNYYIPTDKLPERYRKLNPTELTSEEINISYLEICKQTEKLCKTTIKANTVRLNYLPDGDE